MILYRQPRLGTRAGMDRQIFRKATIRPWLSRSKGTGSRRFFSARIYPAETAVGWSPLVVCGRGRLREVASSEGSARWLTVLPRYGMDTLSRDPLWGSRLFSVLEDLTNGFV